MEMINILETEKYEKLGTIQNTAQEHTHNVFWDKTSNFI